MARKSFYLENKTGSDPDLELDLESECSSTFELLKSLIYKIKLLKLNPEVNKRMPKHPRCYTRYQIGFQNPTIV